MFKKGSQELTFKWIGIFPRKEFILRNTTLRKFNHQNLLRKRNNKNEIIKSFGTVRTHCVVRNEMLLLLSCPAVIRCDRVRILYQVVLTLQLSRLVGVCNHGLFSLGSWLPEVSLPSRRLPVDTVSGTCLDGLDVFQSTREKRKKIIRVGPSPVGGSNK